MKTILYSVLIAGLSMITACGHKEPKVYHQQNVYNDPNNASEEDINSRYNTDSDGTEDDDYYNGMGKDDGHQAPAIPNDTTGY